MKLRRFIVFYSPEPEGYPIFRWPAPRSCRTEEEAVEEFWEDCDGDTDWYHVEARRKEVKA